MCRGSHKARPAEMSKASKQPSDSQALPGASSKEPLAPSYQEKVWAGQATRDQQELAGEGDTPLLLHLHGRK